MLALWSTESRQVELCRALTVRTRNLNLMWRLEKQFEKNSELVKVAGKKYHFCSCSLGLPIDLNGLRMRLQEGEMKCCKARKNGCVEESSIESPVHKELKSSLSSIRGEFANSLLQRFFPSPFVGPAQWPNALNSP